MAKTQAEWNALFANAEAEAAKTIAKDKANKASKSTHHSNDCPATAKQISFINRLMARDPAFASNFVTDPTKLTKRKASQVIENLLAGA